MTLRIVAASLLVIALLLAWPAVRHLREQPPSPPPLVRLALAAPPDAELGSGDDALDAAISPDGRSIVFVATTDGTPRLWRRALDGDRAEPLAGTDGAQLPAWKQTGRVVAFFSGHTLKQLSLDEGVVRDLAEASGPAGVSWLPDGSLVFSPEARGPIRRLHAGAITDATRLRTGDRAHTYPIATDRPGSFVYTAVRDDGTRVARLVADANERELVTTNGHAQLAAGTLLYIRDGVLLAQRYDEALGTLTGRPAPLASGVGVTVTGRGLFTASDRLLLSATSVPRARSIVWLSLDGQLPATAGEPGDYWQLRLSPDDRGIALTMTAPLLRTLDVVIIASEGDTAAQPLSLALAADSDPVWAPDGTRVLFRSLQNGTPNLFAHAAPRKETADEPVLQSPLDETPTDWHDGRILFQAPDVRSGVDLWTFTPGNSAPEAIVKNAFNQTDGRWSPDGRFLAYVSDESGRPEVYALPTNGSSRVRVSFAGGTRPRWRRDSRTLFFLRGSQIMRADIDDGKPPRFGTPRPVLDVPGIRDFDVAHRRDAIVALLPSKPTSTAPVTALVDWQSAVSAAP
jgi:eukaryotic-like serine/threonine-protein kinase